MIYPNTFPIHRQNIAEMKVFESLKTLDKDRFDIFFNKTFALRNIKENQLYEVDFLVFDKTGGRITHIFVIEVKGGKASYSAQKNQWYLGDFAQDTGPDVQVMNYVSFLRARYGQYIENKAIVTWLLWFPDGVKGNKEELPSHLSHWRILDQYALDNPRYYLEQASENIEAKLSNFDGVDLEIYQNHILKDLLQDFTLPSNLKSLLTDMKISFQQVEENQKLFFTGMLHLPRLAIEGCAGSGKSVLAKCAALELSSNGKKTLFLCFNRILKNQLAEELPGEVKVDTVLNFMMEYIQKIDKDWIRSYKAADQSLLEKDIPKKFQQILKSAPVHKDDRFEAIIFDESQDMNESWIKFILKFLIGKGQVFVFFDPMQNIFQREFNLPDSEPWVHIPLNYNHRNSTKINSFINDLVGTNLQSGLVPEGKDVIIKSYSSPEDLIGKLDALLMQLCFYEKVPLEDIKIIVDGSTKDWEYLSKNGKSFTLKSMDPNSVKEKNTIYFTSVNRFKGCEAAVVILILDGPLRPVENPKLRYTQISRAKGLLWVIEKKNEKCSV